MNDLGQRHVLKERCELIYIKGVPYKANTEIPSLTAS